MDLEEFHKNLDKLTEIAQEEQDRELFNEKFDADIRLATMYYWNNINWHKKEARELLESEIESHSYYVHHTFLEVMRMNGKQLQQATKEIEIETDIEKEFRKTEKMLIERLGYINWTRESLIKDIIFDIDHALEKYDRLLFEIAKKHISRHFYADLIQFDSDRLRAMNSQIYHRGSTLIAFELYEVIHLLEGKYPKENGMSKLWASKRNNPNYNEDLEIL